jgi:hypothetical protein
MGSQTEVTAATPAFEEIRTCLAAAVEISSLREVARKVGVSPTGLQKTINGATPYRRTLRKYCGWWFAHGVHVQAPGLALPVTAKWSGTQLR